MNGMRNLLSTALVILLAPLSLVEDSSAQPIDAPAPSPQHEELRQVTQLHQDIVSLCQQIWMQLSVISNQEEADEAAESFSESAQRLTQLDQELQALEQNKQLSPHTQEAMASMAAQIVESYVLLGGEFSAIYNKQCMQSEPLQQSFERALRGGFFFVSHNSDIPLDLPPLNPDEAQQELDRISQLLPPNEEAHACLRCVRDAATAREAASDLLKPIERLHELRPEGDLGLRPFAPAQRHRYEQLQAPLEQSLWDIRHQYVRIAATFAPESEDFNHLANTLDELYLSLEETHARIFTIVFDESFLHDMDEAFAKHNQAPEGD